MDNESEYSKELYDLVEEFQIPCPSEDIMNYLVYSEICPFNDLNKLWSK